MWAFNDLILLLADTNQANFFFFFCKRLQLCNNTLLMPLWCEEQLRQDGWQFLIWTVVWSYANFPLKWLLLIMVPSCGFQCIVLLEFQVSWSVVFRRSFWEMGVGFYSMFTAYVRVYVISVLMGPAFVVIIMTLEKQYGWLVNADAFELFFLSNWGFSWDIIKAFNDEQEQGHPVLSHCSGINPWAGKSHCRVLINGPQ